MKNVHKVDLQHRQDPCIARRTNPRIRTENVTLIKLLIATSSCNSVLFSQKMIAADLLFLFDLIINITSIYFTYGTNFLNCLHQKIDLNVYFQIKDVLFNEFIKFYGLENLSVSFLLNRKLIFNNSLTLNRFGYDIKIQ